MLEVLHLLIGFLNQPTAGSSSPVSKGHQWPDGLIDLAAAPCRRVLCQDSKHVGSMPSGLEPHSATASAAVMVDETPCRRLERALGDRSSSPKAPQAPAGAPHLEVPRHVVHLLG